MNQVPNAPILLSYIVHLVIIFNESNCPLRLFTQDHWKSLQATLGQGGFGLIRSPSPDGWGWGSRSRYPKQGGILCIPSFTLKFQRLIVNTIYCLNYNAISLYIAWKALDLPNSSTFRGFLKLCKAFQLSQCQIFASILARKHLAFCFWIFQGVHHGISRNCLLYNTSGTSTKSICVSSSIFKRVLTNTVALPSIEISSGRVPGDGHKTGKSLGHQKHQELEGVQSCASKWECHILQRWLKVHSLWASVKIRILYVASHEMPKPSKTTIGILKSGLRWEFTIHHSYAFKQYILMVPKRPKREKWWESSRDLKSSVVWRLITRFGHSLVPL